MAYEGNSTLLFNDIADALVKDGADDTTKVLVLAALMDRVGVPMMSFKRYLGDPAIVALFNSRGVRSATDEEKVRYDEGTAP